MSQELLDSVVDHLLALEQPDGGFLASATPGYLGTADGRASDIAPAVYVAEILQTLGLDLPHPDRTAVFIQSRQTAQGYFQPHAGWSGEWTCAQRQHSTCIGIRGLKALGREPAINPRPWLDDDIRGRSAFGPYEPDFYANSCAALEQAMAEDCERQLAEVLLARQDSATGWLMESVSDEPGWGFPRNNPITFHAARFFHLAGKRIPRAEQILAGFMDVQQGNGSWSLGGVHGNFDAAVAVRVLSDNSGPYRAAVRRAAEYALTCRTEDGGFRHFSTEPPEDLADTVANPSDVDAAYFHVATLVMGGLLTSRLDPANDWIGWGHSLVSAETTPTAG